MTQQKPKPASIYDNPIKLAGVLEFSEDKSGKSMVIFRLDGYSKPFYAFKTEDKILPSGKKSFRTTSYHVVQFPDESSGSTDSQLCGALWERYSASREKQLAENTSLGPDKYRIRIDGDLQNYMAYEGPSYLLHDHEMTVFGRVWEKTTRTGDPMLSVMLNQRDRETLVAFPKAATNSSCKLVRFLEDGETEVVGKLTLTTAGQPKSLQLSDSNFEYSFKKTAGSMVIFPVKVRKPKAKDLEASSLAHAKEARVPAISRSNTFISSKPSTLSHQKKSRKL